MWIEKALKEAMLLLQSVSCYIYIIYILTDIRSVTPGKTISFVNRMSTYNGCYGRFQRFIFDSFYNKKE